MSRATRLSASIPILLCFSTIRIVRRRSGFTIKWSRLTTLSPVFLFLSQLYILQNEMLESTVAWLGSLKRTYTRFVLFLLLNVVSILSALSLSHYDTRYCLPAAAANDEHTHFSPTNTASAEDEEARTRSGHRTSSYRHSIH